MGAISVLYYDKENKQKDYEYVAKDINGKLVAGWIVIEKPWYSPESAWTYWMYSNKYDSGGMCGSASDLGLERTKVNPETIKPFNQIEEIKYNLEHGLIVKIRDEYYRNGMFIVETLAVINNVNEIPYELWQ